MHVMQAYVHSYTRSGTSQWKSLHPPCLRNSRAFDQSCLPNEANFLLCKAVLYIKTLLFVHCLVAIKYLKNHNDKDFNKISAYFKNLCLKFNFDKYENLKCHPLLVLPNFTFRIIKLFTTKKSQVLA